MKKSIVISGISLLFLSLSFAQAPTETAGKKLIEMSVDMPDETQETDLLEKGNWQVETAYLHNIYKEGKHSSIWQGFFRYGISKHVELRLLLEAGSELQRYIEETVQSTYPAAASAKILLLKDHKFLPDISLVFYLQLPFYRISKDKKAYWSPIFLLAFQNELGKKWKLDYNAGIQQEAFSTRWAWVGNASLHCKLLENWELFTEYFAQYQHGEGPQHNLGGGIACQVNNYIEVFAMAGGTVNYDASNHYFNSGVAFKIP
ncbi:MAG: transporter [Chitinophagaceae bacterium]